MVISIELLAKMRELQEEDKSSGPGVSELRMSLGWLRNEVIQRMDTAMYAGMVERLSRSSYVTTDRADQLLENQPR